MDARDDLRLALSAVRAYPLRSALAGLGIAIGIASVVLLTSIGEGTRRHLLSEFTQFGTNILQVTPGSTETVGIPGVLGGSTRKLTLEDAAALERVPAVERSLPVVVGQARVEAGELGRSVYVYGATSDLPAVWKFGVRQGSFLPPGDPTRGGFVAVLGPTLKRELFGTGNALGRFVRIAGTRFRVIGLMEPKGRLLGFDMDDAAYVPAVTALRLFNLKEVTEIDVTFREGFPSERVADDVRALLAERHGGEEDFTVLTQTTMLAVLDDVMRVVVFAVGAIAGISLLVGAVGILTIMWIAVGERTAEIGLARALGATRTQVLVLFLTESAWIAGAGGLCGLLLGFGALLALERLVAGLPVHAPVAWALAGLVTSVLTGLLSGLIPARRAAALDPIEALRAE